jgi:hypothetical protein
MVDRTFVEIDYTNHRGERRVRRVQPLSDGLQFTSNEYHPEPQWLMFAVDPETDRVKTFAMQNIHSWRPAQ